MAGGSKACFTILRLPASAVSLIFPHGKTRDSAGFLSRTGSRSPSQVWFLVFLKENRQNMPIGIVLTRIAVRIYPHGQRVLAETNGETT